MTLLCLDCGVRLWGTQRKRCTGCRRYATRTANLEWHREPVADLTEAEIDRIVQAWLAVLTYRRRTAA